MFAVEVCAMVLLEIAAIPLLAQQIVVMNQRINVFTYQIILCVTMVISAQMTHAMSHQDAFI